MSCKIVAKWRNLPNNSDLDRFLQKKNILQGSCKYWTSFKTLAEKRKLPKFLQNLDI